MKIQIPENTILTSGSHNPGQGQCARELLHLLVKGSHADATPPCLTVHCAILPIINDWSGWISDQERTEFLLPYICKFAECQQDQTKDIQRAFALADYAVRIIAEIKCNPIVDAKTAAEAAMAARAAARAARAAARAAAEAAWAARAAAEATWAAARAARAAAEAAARAAEAAMAAWAARAAEAAEATWAAAEAAEAAEAAARAAEAAEAARAAARAARAAETKTHFKALLDLIVEIK